jgi:O-antigen ligase
MSFNIKENIILSLGKDATLTGRDEIWKEVFKMKTDPLIGAGFESFWLGDRLETLWEKFPFQPNQAHNGYIETYINLGLIGFFSLCSVIFSSFRNIRKMLMFPLDLDFGRFRMGFLSAFIIYNISEAACRGLHFLFLIFFIIAIEYPHVKAETVNKLAGTYELHPTLIAHWKHRLQKEMSEIFSVRRDKRERD